jgi:hypothetical protein
MVDSLRPVPVGACRCPGAPHEDGDVVSLDAELSNQAGIAAQSALLTGESWEERYAGLLTALMRFSVREWTFLDDDGPIHVTPTNVDKHLPWLKGGREVVAAVSELHQATILVPFVEAFSQRTKEKRTKTPTSLPVGSTDTSSTSPTPITPRKRRTG